VTLPSEDDFTSLSTTVLRTWKKQREEKRRIQLREQIRLKLDTSFEWSTKFIRHNSPEIQQKFILDFQWEISEELLYLLRKHGRLTDPFDKTKWCPLSQTLLQKALHAIANYMISEGEETDVLLSKIISLASKEVQLLQEMGKSETEQISFNQMALQSLSFCLDSTASDGKSFLITKSIETHKLSVEEFLHKPQPLDTDW
jgi:hypothetical protein